MLNSVLIFVNFNKSLDRLALTGCVLFKHTASFSESHRNCSVLYYVFIDNWSKFILLSSLQTIPYQNRDILRTLC